MITEKEYFKRCDEIDKLAVSYDKALAFVRENNLLRELVDLLNTYKPGDAAEKAVYILGQCAALTRELREAFGIIETYERMKENLDKLRDLFPKIGSSETGMTGDFALRLT